MQFIVTGYDGTDDKALDRRMAAREAHLAIAGEMHNAGRWLYAAAILDKKGTIAGSMIVCEFDSRDALEEEWLDREPYVLGKVWEKIEITGAKVASFWEK